jgi:hypothetical protein
MERPTHWKMDIGYGTWSVMNLMGQDTENSCKRKLDLLEVKGSVRWGKVGNKPADDCTFFTGMKFS